jgi:hypothetical protein
VAGRPVALTTPRSAFPRSWAKSRGNELPSPISARRFKLVDAIEGIGARY